jgi:hypothetical protein
MPVMACLFYLFVLLSVISPAIFMWTFWRDAKGRNWNYTTDTSRAMYVDVAKTLITASGIGVALTASVSTRVLDSIAKFSIRVGVVCLVICIPASLVTMLAANPWTRKGTITEHRGRKGWWRRTTLGF